MKAVILAGDYGTLFRQPVFVQLRKYLPDSFRVAGALVGAGGIMRRVLPSACFPALPSVMLAYEIDVIRACVRAR